MKLNISRRGHQPIIIMASALLLMAVLLTGANVSYAGPDDSESKTAVKLSLTERMDAHLSMLHTKLQITKAQEDQWQKFARVMLENNKTMQDLQEKRQKEVRLMTALDDLKSYSEIADAHAGGLKKFIPAFEALYNSMTDEQKRNADSLFLNQREIMSGKRASN